MSTNQAIQRPENREDEYRVGRGAVRLLTIPGYRFFMVDGSGPPGEGAFESRMPGLYGAAFGLRFAMKRRGAVTKVGPLEGLWWHAEDARNLDEILAGDRAAWRWTLMIVVPDEATEAEIQEHLASARTKVAPEIASTLRVEQFEEGDAAQVLHIGPYAEERQSIERLHADIAAAGFHPRGRHHELYLGDPQRSAPERLRTIIRQPIER
jgi:hypothetical protein